MKLNNVLIIQAFVSRILTKNGECELDKDLKFKILDMRIKLSKFKIKFDKDCVEALNFFTPEEYNDLLKIEEKTPEQLNTFSEISKEIGKNYNMFLEKYVDDEVDFDMSFSIDEYNQIAKVNIDNDVEINGSKFTATDFLETIYNIIVKE